MAQETLKITITADNKQAVQNIQETVVATTQSARRGCIFIIVIRHDMRNVIM